MLPWGHAGLGYLCYHLWLRLRGRLPPNGHAVLALLVGTQFPDLLDKPATWVVPVLPSGRSLGHSLLALGLVALAVVVVERLATDRETRVPPLGRTRVWGAFLGGWAAHLLGDVYVLPFDPTTCVRYLLWPLLDHCVYPNDTSAIGWLAAFEFQSGQFVGVGVALVAGVLWWRDGRPGLETLRGWVRRWRSGR